MFCKAKYLTHQAACNAALAFTCCFFFLCACGLRYNESENTSKNRGKLKKVHIYIYISACSLHFYLQLNAVACCKSQAACSRLLRRVLLSLAATFQFFIFLMLLLFLAASSPLFSRVCVWCLFVPPLRLFFIFCLLCLAVFHTHVRRKLVTPHL